MDLLDIASYNTLLISEGRSTNKKKTKKAPKKWVQVIPLEETVLFPYTILPVTLTKKKEIDAIQKLYKKREPVAILAPQKKRHQNQLENFYAAGTTAKILRIVPMPNDYSIVLLQGQQRFTPIELKKEKQKLIAYIQPLTETALDKKEETKALLESILEITHQILEIISQETNEVQENIESIKDPIFLIYYIAANIISFEQRQRLLLAKTTKTRAKLLLEYLIESLRINKLKQKLQDKANRDLMGEKKEAFLKYNIKLLQNELGEGNELQTLQKKSKKKKWNKEIQTHFDKTIQKLERMSQQSAEYSTYLHYADLMLDLPWDTYTKDNLDLDKATTILDSRHYGMKKVKERLLEFLAVHTLKKGKKGFIICLLGPPGIGKTTIAKSIAESLGRKFIKISLGGVHDEAKIRGHRKTYVASIEGNIINAIKKARSSNPVILLDEIDKIDKTRGDCEAALLEVLDPAQNNTFKDNYLEVPFDLSQVLFITTANNEENISWPLIDRMEFIEIEGYATEEKIEIAKKYLLPDQLAIHGLSPKTFKLTDKALEKIIQEYTSESGVRELSRKIAAICRKIAKFTLAQKTYTSKVTPKEIPSLLGIEKFNQEDYQKINTPGTSVGLAWTPVGGSILFIDTALVKGEGKLSPSGQLGEVMEESAMVAYTYLRANFAQFNIDPRLFKQYDLHIHIAPGATSKDGPSAGITLLTAFVSLYTQRKAKDKIAMTGEISLRGKVLPVGGIKEKVLAAKRTGIKEIILSKKNKKDVLEIKPKHIDKLTFHFVDKAEEALKIALQQKKVPNGRIWEIEEKEDKKTNK